MTKIVEVDLNEIIGLELEGFLNLLEERCGVNVLSDISYAVVGSHNGQIQIEVNAEEVDTSNI